MRTSLELSPLAIVQQTLSKHDLCFRYDTMYFTVPLRRCVYLPSRTDPLPASARKACCRTGTLWWTHRKKSFIKEGFVVLESVVLFLPVTHTSLQLLTPKDASLCKSYRAPRFLSQQPHVLAYSASAFYSWLSASVSPVAMKAGVEWIGFRRVITETPRRAGE